MTGTLGRRAPGESWLNAMASVGERIEAGSKKRYQVYGYKIDDGWWAYSIRPSPRKPHVLTEPIQMSHQRIAELARTLPRCAQRARDRHGGGFKMAILDQKIAQAMATFLGVKVYLCKLPAPAIGEHWHIATTKKTKRKAAI